jgi:hypothetical protein
MTKAGSWCCLVLILAVGCTGAPQTLDRCHASLHLKSLAERVGLPRQSAPWGWSTGEESRRGLHYDVQQRVTLALDSPGELTRAICDALRDELAERCDLPEAWIGADACTFVTTSRPAVDERGRYLRRPAQGRVTLFAAPAAEAGRTELVLAATEWED